MDKTKLKRLADYAVREGTAHTTDGRCPVSYDEHHEAPAEELAEDHQQALSM